MFWNNKLIEDIIDRAIKEDIWTGDITSESLIPSEAIGKANILVKEEGVLAGLTLAEKVFYRFTDEIVFEQLADDGDLIQEGQLLAEIKGPVREILKGERIALNFLQRLSGIASRTRKYVEAVSDYPVKIVDTRKTTPTLRILEKYAVKVGGAYNHRMGLYDAVMIKDNHIKAAGGIYQAVESIKEKLGHTIKIEIEVEDYKGLEEALEAGVDIIMLDNMDPTEMAGAVQIIDNRAIVEASGGITLESIQEVASSGVDIISVGALTHHIKSLDISLNLE
ncbi:carboxylating nicotinate-nucleotide diphosphorylase [Natronospora cellulosivora (SeqCode)]